MSAASSVPTKLTPDQVLRIAYLDAERAYRDLSPYRVEISLEQDGWHVDFRLKILMNGGGPHYIIDPQDGRILMKRYEQ